MGKTAPRVPVAGCSRAKTLQRGAACLQAFLGEISAGTLAQADLLRVSLCGVAILQRRTRSWRSPYKERAYRRVQCLDQSPLPAVRLDDLRHAPGGPVMRHTARAESALLSLLEDWGKLSHKILFPLRSEQLASLKAPNAYPCVVPVMVVMIGRRKLFCVRTEQSGLDVVWIRICCVSGQYDTPRFNFLYLEMDIIP